MEKIFEDAGSVVSLAGADALQNLELCLKAEHFLGVFMGVSVVVIAAILLDLWDGIHTANATGAEVHSHKLRITIAKVSEYWRFLLVAFLVDCLGFLFPWYGLPFVTLLFGAGLVAVEAKSMFEHAARRKSKMRELPGILGDIVACTHEGDARKILDKICKTFVKE